VRSGTAAPSPAEGVVRRVDLIPPQSEPERDRPAGSSCAPAQGRPAWGRLYAILPITGLLCAATHWALPGGLWRDAGAYGVVALTVTLFALWVASNRSVLARAGNPSDPSPVRVLYVFLPVRPWRSATATGFPSSPPTCAELPRVVGGPALPPLEVPRP
jgi:hypothetical protein